MRAVELLGAAQRLLHDADVDGLSPRLAAFLARQALEEIIDQRCADVAAAIPAAKVRNKLLVLRTLDDAQVAQRAALAWHRLSNACHVHAYELQPSVAEIKHLCGMVADLLPHPG